MPLPNLNIESLKDNPLASQLGIKGTNNNMLQFYNRFGENNLIQERPLSTVFTQPFYFDTIWSFDAGKKQSKTQKKEVSNVEKMLLASMKESNSEALKFFIQSIDIPDIESYSPLESMPSEVGMASNTGLFIKPTSNTFTIEFLSTEFSLHEHVFYYWMRETTSNEWVYDYRPYTKAKIIITFLDSNTKHRMFSYILTNVFPIGISTLKPSHAGESVPTRPVSFSFDNMYVIPASEAENNILEKAFNKYIGDPLGRKMTTGVNKKLPTIKGI